MRFESGWDIVLKIRNREQRKREIVHAGGEKIKTFYKNQGKSEKKNAYKVISANTGIMGDFHYVQYKQGCVGKSFTHGTNSVTECSYEKFSWGKIFSDEDEYIKSVKFLPPKPALYGK